MRRYLRYAFKIDGWYWIIILSLILLGIYFVLPYDAHAISRAELNQLDDDVQTWKEKIQDKTTEIEEKQKQIKLQEDEISKIKDEIRDKRQERNNPPEDKSEWDIIKEISEIESELKEAEDLYEAHRIDLGNLIDQRSTLIRELDQKEFDFNNAELDRPPSLSHLDKKIGVILSKTCITMITNNINSTCPTYKDLVQLDSSRTEITGKFTTEDGFFHRGDPSVKNPWRYFDNDETIRVFVDPPAGMIERVKLIEIHPNFDTYFLQNDMTVHDKFEYVDVKINGTAWSKARTVQSLNQTSEFARVVYHDRYIDDCKHATINADIWKDLVADTIHLMRNGCDPSFSSYNEREVIAPDYTEIDITTSPNWQYLKWLEDVSNHCIFKYREC